MIAEAAMRHDNRRRADYIRDTFYGTHANDKTMREIVREYEAKS